MKKLFFKCVLYFVLILLCLEVLVRVFHLYNELPEEYIAEDGISKWIPGQEGYSVFGNRRQVFAKYQINESGYNSYREFNPTADKYEIALLGDSFIEGFHQNYYNSTGKKIELLLNEDVEALEYGHSSNDFADQVYLIHKNQETFNLIDHIFIRLKFDRGLRRSEYEFIKREPLFGPVRKSKLAVYALRLGVMDPIKDTHQKLMTIKNEGFSGKSSKKKKEINKKEFDSIRIYNFNSLISKYGFDKSKTTLLIDGEEASKTFIKHLEDNNIKYIDYSVPLKEAGKKRPTDLIYDKHWNNYGRSIIANTIAEYVKEIRKE